MPPKSKSKKTKASNASRGFATTSIPKSKPVQEQPPAPLPSPPSPPKDPTKDDQANDGESDIDSGTNIGDDNTHAHGESSRKAANRPQRNLRSSGKGEREIDVADLQRIRQKEEEQCESELSVLITKLSDVGTQKADTYFDQSRKLSINGLPVLKMDARLEHDVIRLLKETGEALFDPSTPATKSRDKTLAKLNTIYLILLRFGFTKEEVQQAMKETRGGELDDALDWVKMDFDLHENVFLTLRQQLCLYLPSERLPVGFADKTYYEEKMSISVIPARDEKPIEQLLATTNKTETIFQRTSPKGTPTTTLTTSDAKSWILNSLSETDSNNEQEPNTAHALLRLDMADQQKRLEAATVNGSASEMNAASKRIESIRSKINQLEMDFSFDKKTAEKLFREEKIRREKEKNTEAKRVKRAAARLAAEEVEAATATADTFDGQDFTMGDLFGNDADEPSSTKTTTSTTTTTIVIRDMSAKSTGQLPKDVLSKFCRKRDRDAKVTFHRVGDVIAGGYRAGVKIVWMGEKSVHYEMETEACATLTEAENYAATLALYHLTSLPLYQSLPPPYRDLWMEWLNEKESEESRAKRAVEEEKIAFFLTLLDSDDKNAQSTKTQQGQTQLARRRSKSHAGTVTVDPMQETAAGTAKKVDFGRRKTQKSYQDLLAKRKDLPIHAFREHVVDSLARHQVLIVSGETGCGKSTQVPQFIAEDLLEKGYGDRCKIVCTQPRRISAISIANRVSLELGDARNSTGMSRSLVGYQIRLESRVSDSNVLVFCTTGILLRRLESDQMLEGVTHVIVDEVHERTLESDFLLIVLKQLLLQRPDLNVILMSATVEARRFSAYFDDCPVLEVPGRTFPVEVQYLENVIEATGYTLEEGSEYTRRVHKRIRDEGTISVAGKHGTRQNIRLRWEEDPYMDNLDDYSVDGPSLATAAESDNDLRISPRTRQVLNRIDEHKINYDLLTQLLELICFSPSPSATFTASVPSEGAILIFLPGMPEIRRLYDQLLADRRFSDETRFMIWPLHSLISSDGQSAVFDEPPKGIRKIVLATNIAETGITIPDVTIVIDTGKVNQVRFDERRRITNLQETFISKANARQRRGRAGRVQEGLCFHLFSKYRHDREMQEYQVPEMLRLPLEELCLKIKICKLGEILPVLEKALDPPPVNSVENAIKALRDVRAFTPNEQLTPLGAHLGNLPVDVHIGKMIIFSAIFKCLDPILTIAAALSFKSPFVTPFGKEDEAEAAKRSFKCNNSDLLTWYKAYLSWRDVYRTKPNTIRDFCARHFLSHQNLLTIEDMKKDFLGHLVHIGFVNMDEQQKSELSRMNYRRAHCSVPSAYNENASAIPIVNAVIAAGLYPNILYRSPTLKQFVTGPNGDFVYIHPSSVNFLRDPKSHYGSAWFAYHTMVKSSKVYVWETSAVMQYPLVLFGGDLDVKHEANQVSVDKWIKFKCHAKTAVIFKLMRKEVDQLLLRRIDTPGANLTTKEARWLDMITNILQDEPKE